MTFSLPTRFPAYTLTDGLQELASVSSVCRTTPDEWLREELLLRKLGPKGWGRVHHFRNYYQGGWGQDGRVLSPKALDAFFRFVEQVNFPTNRSFPSVFLTDRGGIELCWEDINGKAVQVEFNGTGAEFYRAATEKEGSVTLEQLPSMSQQLFE